MSKRLPSLFLHDPGDLDGFLRYCVTAVDDAPEHVTALVMTEAAGPGITVLGLEEGDDPNEGLDRLTITPVTQFLALATVMAYSPEEQLPTEPSWVIVGVERGKQAGVAVRYGSTGRWYREHIEDAPWILLSTAGGLRGALNGKRPTWKTSRDERLFNKPGEGDAPPVDEEGRI